MTILGWLGGILLFIYLLDGLVLALRINATGGKLSRLQFAFWVIAWPIMLWLNSK